MKISIAKIAGWIGRALLSAAVADAADRLSRPKHAQGGGEHQQREIARLDRK